MKYTFLPVTLLLAVGFFSPGVQANTSSVLPQFQVALAKGKNLNAAVQAIKKKTRGRILSTRTINKNGNRVYKIKVLLPSGKVQTFTVNAQ